MSSGFIEKIQNNIHNSCMEDRHKQKLSYPLRMPDDLRAKLEAEAAKIGRSLHAEILFRLENSITPASTATQIAHSNVDEALEAVADEFQMQSRQLISTLLLKHGVKTWKSFDENGEIVTPEPSKNETE